MERVGFSHRSRAVTSWNIIVRSHESFNLNVHARFLPVQVVH